MSAVPTNPNSPGDDSLEHCLASVPPELGVLLYQTLATHYPNGFVLLLDQDLRLLSAEGSALERLTLGDLPLQGNPLSALVPPPVYQQVEPLCRSALIGFNATTEIVWHHGHQPPPQGDRIFQITTLSVSTAGDRSPLAIFLAQDITTINRMETLLDQTNQKLTHPLEARLANLQTMVQRLQQESTRRQQTQIALLESEERYRSVVAALQEGIMLQDRHGCIQTCNGSARKMLGLSAERLIGKTLRDIHWHAIHEDGTPFLLADHPALLTLATGTPYSNVMMGLSLPDGSRIWVSVNSQPLFHPGDLQPCAVVTSLTNMTERKQQEERLRLLESVVVNAKDSVVITAAEPIDPPDPRILYANDAFTQMTGYTLEEIQGKTPRFLQGPNTDPRTLAKMQDALQNWQPIQVELINYRKDGAEFWVEVSITPICDRNGRYTHWVLIQRDITHRKQLEQDLLRTLEKEKELSELKSRFVSMTSHEFRTPLSTILSAAELLEYYGAGWTQAEQLEQLHLIENTVQHMTQLLEDVLLIGRAEADRLEFSPTFTDVTRFCHELIAQIQVSAGDRYSIAFTSHCPLLRAWIDEKLWRQIITNLVSNAMKYSPLYGKVEVDLATEAGRIVLQVKDTGIGIPTEDLPRLFESFHRGKNVGTIPGTGLGLAIVKHCVSSHSGHITVDSQVNGGTTFRVSVPMTAASPEDGLYL